MSNKVKKVTNWLDGIYCTVILWALYNVGMWMYNTIKPSLEAEIAVKQLEDSIFIYSFVNRLIQHDLVANLWFIFILVLTLLVWRNPIINLFSKKEGEINE